MPSNFFVKRDDVNVDHVNKFIMSKLTKLDDIKRGIKLL